MNGHLSEMNNKAPVNRHQYTNNSFGSSQIINKIVKINTDSDHNGKHNVEVITRDANNQKFLKIYKLTHDGVNGLINSLQSSNINNVDIQYVSDDNNMVANGFGAPMGGGNGNGFGLTGDEVVTKHPEYMSPNPIVNRDSYKQTMNAKSPYTQPNLQQSTTPMESDPNFNAFGGSGMELAGFGDGNISGNDVSSLKFNDRNLNFNVK
jgi:hypothetical protein